MTKASDSCPQVEIYTSAHPCAARGQDLGRKAATMGKSSDKKFYTPGRNSRSTGLTEFRNSPAPAPWQNLVSNPAHQPGQPCCCRKPPAMRLVRPCILPLKAASGNLVDGEHKESKRRSQRHRGRSGRSGAGELCRAAPQALTRVTAGSQATSW